MMGASLVLLLLYGSAILDYKVGLLIDQKPEQKKWYLSLSLCGNLGMLGYFKYTNFFIDTLIIVFESLGIQSNLSSLNIILPVGISFLSSKQCPIL